MQYHMLQIKYFEGRKNEELPQLTFYIVRLWQDSFKPVQLLIEGRKVLAREGVRNHPAVWWFLYSSLISHPAGQELESVFPTPGL